MIAENNEKQTKAFHGLYRSLIQNMVLGVSQGYKKTILLEGVGYRVSKKGNTLIFLVGFCHPIEYMLPPHVKAILEGNTTIVLESHDKQLIGKVASEIRGIRPPEPYKGKGIRYAEEQIRRKVGKAMAK